MRHPLETAEVQKQLKKVAYMQLPSILSRVTFTIVPSRPELVNCLPNILHFTLITGKKVDQVPFITIKFVIYYVRVSCQSTGES